MPTFTKVWSGDVGLDAHRFVLHLRVSCSQSYTLTYTLKNVSWYIFIEFVLLINRLQISHFTEHLIQIPLCSLFYMSLHETF